MGYFGGGHQVNRYFAIGAYAVLAGMTGLSPAAAGTWPKHTVTDAQRQVGIAEAKLYRDQKNDAAPRSQEYRPDGDYLNYGKTTFHRPSDKLKLDADGLPTMLQAGAFQYNPGTIANFALAEHGRKSDKFLVAAEKLRSMQGADGALRYGYTYRHYTVTHAYAPGWISGMDQGLALSVYARAYLATSSQHGDDGCDASYSEPMRSLLTAAHERLGAACMCAAPRPSRMRTKATVGGRSQRAVQSSAEIAD